MSPVTQQSQLGDGRLDEMASSLHVPGRVMGNTQEEEEEEDAAYADSDDEEESTVGSPRAFAPIHVPTIKTNETDYFNHTGESSMPSKRTDNLPPAQDPLSLMRTVSARSARPTISRTATRNNTFVDGLKRTVTGTSQFAPSRSQPFSYTFDPLPSDESDSSSSSEEEAPIKQRRRAKSALVGGRSGTDEDIGSVDTEAERKQARRGLSYSQFKLGNDHLETRGKVSRRDGRLRISVNETASRGYVAKALSPTIKHHLEVSRRRRKHESRKSRDEEEVEVEPSTKTEEEKHTVPPATRLRAATIATAATAAAAPKLNIVIMVIGSRGDIQPFLKVGKILQHKYGHRVRVATHPAFRDFVTKDAGLEFFSVGGDPAQLMAFMVKNPGLIPSVQTLREGEIGRRREQMAEMMMGFWRACINSTDDEGDKGNLKLLDNNYPFIADAIIANPPSFAHVHIAERLGIPLHMMFTFPYSPTTQFPHPLANIRPNKSNVDTHYVNFMSYPMVEMMTWQGLGDLVNDLRVKTLGLEPISSLWAPGALYRMKVPYTYLWSPSLVPKPADWGPEIDLAGFVFLDLATNYTPPQDLKDFLDAGEPPVYLGFGSIVVDDPDRFTQMIFKAVKIAGVRAIINKGWGGFGGEGKNTPEGIHMINNVPHDWLFPRMKAVVHHGGAGTTAIGLKCAKPTMIVPFFGDQPFWGAMVAEAKAGAFECIPYKKLTVERMAEGIKQCLTEEAQVNVQRIADSIAAEGDGAENAVMSFLRSVPLAGRHSMRCSILQDHVAVWRLRHSSLRLSALAAELLVQKGKLKWSDLKLVRHLEWNDFDGPGEPITGSTGAVTKSLYGMGEGVGMVPVRIAKHIRKREDHERRKKAIAERRRKKLLQLEQAEKVEKTEAPQPVSNDTLKPQRPQAERNGTTATLTSVISADPKDPLYREVADDVASGLAKSGYALINLPLNLHLAIAQGFHNAPRLYGDATVRRPTKITGVKSGFKAAGKEFSYGVYDGFTGLVTQPVGGWKDEVGVPAKFAGLGKGFAKGVGGFVLKNLTAIIAPPVFVSLGVRKYAEKRIGGTGARASVRQARMNQGQEQLEELQKEAKEEDTTEKEGRGRGEKEGQHETSLAKIEELVDDGWKVYEELWAETHRFQVGHGPRAVGKFRFERERRHWIESGLLENVHTARKALEAKRRGEDVFDTRKEELKEAEEPRRPALGGSDASSHKDPQHTRQAQTEREDSDGTLVAAPAASVDEKRGVGKEVRGDVGLASAGIVS